MMPLMRYQDPVTPDEENDLPIQRQVIFFAIDEKQASEKIEYIYCYLLK